MTAIFMPIDVICLLIDKLPIYMHAVCAYVPFFNSSYTCASLLQHDPTIYMVIKDVIKRNDVEYCKQHFSEEKMAERTRKSIIWDDTAFVKREGIYYRYWKQAIKYGRIEIMDFFHSVSAKATTPQFYPTEYSSYLIKIVLRARDTATRLWLLDTFHEYKLSADWIGEMVCGAVRHEDITALTWLHSHTPRTSLTDPAHNSIYTYLEQAIIIRINYGGYDDIVQCIITKRPKVLAWCRQQKWKLQFNWEK
jgi:hypothetical protein